MSSFIGFSEAISINESLTTPVEFVMTDDTEMPRRIYATFHYDGTDYGMSLEESNFDRVYNLRMYRILSKKPRLWSFKKPSHVRPCLSTLLKFVESCVPFIKTKMDGIICHIPGKNLPERYNTFMQRIIRRSYITAFRSVPVRTLDPNEKKAYHMLFVVRKNVNPRTLLKTKAFKRYDFDPDEMMLPDDVAMEIKPKRTSKQTVTLAPSKRYAFKEFAVDEITIDDDVFDNVTTLTVNPLKKISKEDLDAKKLGIAKVKREDQQKLYKKTIDTMNQRQIDAMKADPDKFVMALLAVNTKYFFEQWRDGDHLYNDKSVALNKLTKGLELDITSGKLSRYIDGLAEIGYIKVKNESIKIIAAQIAERLIDDLVTNPEDDSYSSLTILQNHDEIEYAEKKIKELESASFDLGALGVDNVNVHETNIKPEDLVSNIPGAGVFDYSNNVAYELALTTEDGEAVGDKVAHIEHDLGYLDKLRALPKDSLDAAVEYTGGDYNMYNSPLRGVFEGYMEGRSAEGDYHATLVLRESGSITKLWNAFDAIDPLPEGLWVYRGATLPQKYVADLVTGGDFVDPAFLSTSVMSNIDFGYSNVKFRIFLPTGSKVIPILGLSHHSTEREVILPPMSVLKIIRVDEQEVYGERKFYVTCVFVGSAFSSFVDAIKEKNKDYIANNPNLFESAKKPIKYDPNDKFGNVANADTLKKLSKLIKDKRLIIKK